ncbi:outer membrane beta-barrel protein [Congregibacter sp.]|uniref:outer membrane beta-barrel protein n=1 Tax=Congregibacter sp. TaxID=2744308 RepID=UPI003F6B665C
MKIEARTRATKSTLLLSWALAASIHGASAQVSDDSIESNAGSHFINPKHRLSLGIAQQEAVAGISATVDGFEPVRLQIDDLGLNDRDYSYYFDYRYRLKPRWAMFAGAYGFSDSGTRRAERDFNYNGVEYTAGAEIRADLEVDAYIFDVLYAVHRSDRSEVMIGGGLHALDLSAGLAARVNVDDLEASGSRSGTTLLAPVPNLRISGTWVLSQRVAVHAVGGWLSANIDDYSGQFLYGHLRLAYGLTDRASLALGYQRTDIDVTQERSRSEINYDVQLEGFTLTFAYSF